MQIKKAIIENFKSITIEEIDFTHDCKIFVGLSESGKTNLLLALSALDTTFTLNKTFIKEGTKTSEPSLIEYDLSLDKKEKEVIMLRFYKEKTQSQVAKILGITQVQVSRIERRILNSMKLKLTS